MKCPGWVNGGFDIAGKMPNIKNEEEIITLFAADVLNEYKERFLVFNTNLELNERISRRVSAITLPRLNQNIS